MTRAKGRRVMSETTVNDNESSDSEDVDFFNVFDGTKGRSPGVYLDMQERIQAERNRAVLEEREPDLSDLGSLPAATGTPFVPKERQVDNSSYSNPSIAFTGEKEVDPVETLNVDRGTSAADVDLGYAAQVARERKAQDEALASVDSDSGSDANFSEPTNTAGSEFTESTVEQPSDADVEADYNTNDTTI